MFQAQGPAPARKKIIDPSTYNYTRGVVICTRNNKIIFFLAGASPCVQRLEYYASQHNCKNIHYSECKSNMFACIYKLQTLFDSLAWIFKVNGKVKRKTRHRASRSPPTESSPSSPSSPRTGKCGRPANPIPRHKRDSHIKAEHKRRDKIQVWQALNRVSLFIDILKLFIFLFITVVYFMFTCCNSSFDFGRYLYM